MIEIIREHQTELEQLCRQFHVKKLELFGSASDGTFDPSSSDLDFLIEFLPEAGSRIFHGYFEFREALEELFGRKVDLLMPGAIRSAHLREAVERQRRELYAA
jgi:predicted nucleotidyltransferase